MYVYQEGFPAWQEAGHPVEVLDILPNVKIPSIDPGALKKLIDQGGNPVILDIRDTGDRVKAGWIAGSMHLPLDDLMARHGEIPKGRDLVVVDHAGKQTAIACRYLLKQGYTTVRQLDKGIVGGWLAAGLPVQQ